MHAIDWVGLGRNGLWLLGLSLVLAAISHAAWLAKVQRVRVRAALAGPACRFSCWIGLLLCAAGLAWAGTVLWQRTAWIALAAACAWQAANMLRSG